MNGIENIIRRIAAEAEAECSAIEKAADEKSAAVLAGYKKQAEETYETVLSAGEKSAEQFRILSERNARLEAKKDILALKRELVQKAFDIAEEKFLNMPEEEYIAFFGRQAANASVSGKETIAVAEKDLAHAGPAIVSEANRRLKENNKNGELTLSREPRKILGGFVMSAEKVEVDCTIDALLEQGREILEAEVAGILFE